MLHDVLERLWRKLMLTSDPRECVAVDVYGLFDVKDISRLSAIRPM